MKKLFTLICALIGMTATVSAATVNDIKVCEHSYVLVMDNWTSDGKVSLSSGTLFGDDFFLDLKGCSVAENKGTVDLSDAAKWGDAIATKYGKKYGSHRNSLRLKNDANMIAMRVKAGSKLIIFYNGNANDKTSGINARLPKISSDAAQINVLNPEWAPTAETPAQGIVNKEWTAKDDGIIYIGSWNGDIFLSYIIVEVTETISLPNEYNTYCAASSLDFTGNADVEAYTAKMNDSKTAVTLERVYQVPEGAGVILKRVGGKNSATVNVIADAAKLEGNQLVGATEAVPAKTLVDANAYILAGQKFCKVAADATGELAKGKAYLSVPAGVVPTTLSFSIGELTGVESVEAQSKADNTEIYNIQGIRVKQPAKGLYIINGKKYAF
ncbi:MAG: hypothetical protein MSA13_08035 [Prevotella sp.]|nr:hypothetical protein [Prevotella sp.]